MDALNKELEDEKIRKLNEMRVKKQEYTTGQWNVQTVLLGGLGKDPDVEGGHSFCCGDSSELVLCVCKISKLLLQALYDMRYFAKNEQFVKWSLFISCEILGTLK